MLKVYIFPCATMVCSFSETEIRFDYINPFPNKPWFLRVCSTSLLKTLWEKEILLVTSNFSFSHSVFYLFGQLSAILIKLKIVVCKVSQFGRVQNLLFGKGISLYHSISTLTTLRSNPFENTEGKGQNAVNQYFLIFPQCFLSFSMQNSFLTHIYFVACRCFHF